MSNLSSQFDAFGPRPVTVLANMAINNAGPHDFIQGQALKDVYAATNIRKWPIGKPGWDDSRGDRHVRSGVGEDYSRVDNDETLNTTQGHLHAATLRSYRAGNVPEWDDDYADDDGNTSVPYLPEVATTPRGSRWIEEGHHRIIADRLNGRDSRVWDSEITEQDRGYSKR